MFMMIMMMTKTKRPGVKRLSCFSQSLAASPVCAPNQTQRRAARRWRMRDIVVFSAAYSSALLYDVIFLE